MGLRVEGFDHLSIDGLQGGMGMGEEAESRSEPAVDLADGDPQTQTSGGYFEAHWAPWKRQPGATPTCFRTTTSQVCQLQRFTASEQQ